MNFVRQLSFTSPELLPITTYSLLRWRIMTEGLILDYFLEFLAQIICDITIRVDHPTNKRKGNFAPPLVPKCPNDMQIGGQFNFPTLEDTSFAPCLSIPRI